jgi:hypothetical protein
MASFFYDTFWRDIQNGTIDVDTDTIKVALVTSSYTPDQATHDKFDDVTNEVSAAGYTAGGATLANIALQLDTTNHWCDVNADDVQWTANITARAAVVYMSTGTAATSPLIAYLDFGSDQTSSGGGTFTLQLNAEGLWRLGPAA